VQLNKESDQLTKHKLRGTAIDSPREVTECLVTQNDICESPLSDVILKSVETVDDTALLVDGEATLRMSDAFFLLSLEKDL
jgi:hypothetical protein